MPLGLIESLYRYPIKSVLGEQCAQLNIVQRGVEFDRLFAVSNVDGKFGSHKNTRRFRKIDGLFALRSFVRDGLVWVVFPDGSELACGDPRVHQRLSDVCSQPVTLVSEASIPHFDDGAIHILTSSSLTWLRAQLPNSIIDCRRFRPNIVINRDGEGLAEREWIGRVLHIGTCQLEVVSETERCVMTTLSQDELPADPDIMKTITRLSRSRFGVYAKVLRAGTLAAGDRVSFLNGDEHLNDG